MRSDFTKFKVTRIISDHPTSVVIKDTEGHTQDKDIDAQTVKNLETLEKYFERLKKEIQVYESIADLAYRLERAIRAQYYLETGEHMGGYAKQGDYSFNRDQLIEDGKDFKRKIDHIAYELRSTAKSQRVDYITDQKLAKFKKEQKMREAHEVKDAIKVMRKILDTNK